jgi:hypothetical protein
MVRRSSQAARRSVRWHGDWRDEGEIPVTAAALARAGAGERCQSRIGIVAGGPARRAAGARRADGARRG